MSGALSALRRMMLSTYGPSAARRVERVADEIPGVENMYTGEALQRALSQPEHALSVMHPGDFERYAANLVDDKLTPGAYFRSSPDKPVEKNIYGALPGSALKVPRAEYVSQLKGLIGPGRGFNQVPYLSVRELPGATRPPSSISFVPEGETTSEAFARLKAETRAARAASPVVKPLAISSHEGRHRSRALADNLRTKALVTFDLEELPLSWSSGDRDLLIKSFYDRYGSAPEVHPENEWQMRGGRFDAFPRDPVPMPKLFSAGGVARKGIGALARIAREEKQLGTVRLGEREIPVTQHPVDERIGNAPVTVRVRALDDAWRSTDADNYVGPQGAGGIAGRYERFADFIREAPSMRASQVYVSPRGRVMFGDGRHRFSYLRDQGVESVPMSMDAESVETARRLGLID